MFRPTVHSTALIMRVIGWCFIPLLFALLLLYPDGFAWGIERDTQYHPYLWMMLMLYLAWCYLLIREASNPSGAGLLFDFGIIANCLHGLLMIVQTIMMWKHEMPHLWADIPLLFVLVLALWLYHPNKIQPEQS
jgi:hypothetical protein